MMLLSLSAQDLFILKKAQAAATAGGAASNYPVRPVRIIVGFPPGSGTDTVARFMGGKLTERLGQQIVVDNRPGANGIIAAEITANAAPDGHTLLFMSVSHTMNAVVYKQLPFDPVKSFTPITTIGSGPLVLVSHPSFTASDAKGLIDLARAKPDSITYAVSGTGGINHFGGALFASMAGIKLNDVPYKGGVQATTDLIGGRVQTMFGTLTLTLPHIRAGKLKALGVSTASRTPLLPDTPAITASGLPGYEISTWWGALAPAGVPGPIVTRLNKEIAVILNEPESAKVLIAGGAQPSPISSSEFGRLLGNEIAKWREIARTADITAK
ncbi:MAG: tripartite tricarboxylate transporter substrate binding protein [Burkholderiales bacterium]|nr:tripartite tricarboxylate transporter substrate binding protein [Burkholderiales bacterium]